MKQQRMRIRVPLSLMSCAFLLMTTTLAYESRMENRGYTNVPYARDEDDNNNNDARMSDRSYNSDPLETNVDGRDNVFSREEGCIPDANGMFGSSQGVAQSLGFYYQVEILPIVGGREEGKKEMIGKVESSISKTLLPSLFVEQCAVTERSRQSNQWQGRRLVEMLGISTLPKDTVLEGVECEGELTNDLNECYVVDGNITLYSESAVEESFLNELRNIIRVAMTNGVFNTLDPRLINVSYRESLDTADAAGADTTVGSTGGSDSLPAYAWVIIGVGAAALLIGAGVAFSRGRSHSSADAETGSFPDQSTSFEPV